MKRASCLKQALDLASAAGLDKHAIKARTHIHFGVVIIGGFNQRDLGIKQFKKAIEIQADIALTKSLVTPELTEAFAEAKKGPDATPPPQPPPPEPMVKTPPPKPAEPEKLGTGLTHEPVAEGKQGSAISITVEVADEMEFEKLILAYRPEGASDFLGREMKEVADGKYGAEIPNSATSGGTVAYYIEAEDKDGGPIAARGSVDNPIVIHLLGVGITKNDDDDDDDDDGDGDDEGPEKRLFVGLMAGMGMGWATGTGDTNADVMISPSGVAPAGLVQVSPEFGYWMDSSLMLSLQIRYQYITGTTDIYAANNKVYHTANYALAAFAKATWKFGGSESKFHPFFSLSAGAGRIRHVVSFKRQMLTNCGRVAHGDLHRHDRRRAHPGRPGRRRHVRARRQHIAAGAGEHCARVPRLQRPPRRQRRRRVRVLGFKAARARRETDARGASNVDYFAGTGCTAVATASV